MTPRKYTYHFVFLLCCLYTSSVVKGQGTCSGSALAPVFSQTFGQGASSSSKTSVPSGFSTNYSFQSSGALNDGAYIVTPRVQNSGRNDWAQGSDHTGNSNGNMFLVNAGTGGSVFFTQQVDNLCPGSTYNFSAWLANVNTTSNTLPICGSGYVYPNVRFNIKNTSGTILATYSTGNLPLTANTSVAPNWQQYGFSFALPSGTTSLVLEMLDAYGGLPQCGNDLAIDDILFTACTPTASINFTTASTVCSGTNTTITSSIVNSPFTNPAYQWQKSTNGGTTWSNIGTPGTSATNFDLNNISSADQASYRVLVGPDIASLSSNTCITASSAISLTVIQSPSASVSSNSPVCSGNNIQLTSTVSNNIATTTYNWTGPGGYNTSVANPLISNAQVSQSGTYTLLVTSGNNCTATASTNVIVNATPTVAAITGNDGGCVGSSFTLSNTTAGGTWSSSNPLVASIDNNGFVNLLQDGTTTISYTVIANGCSNTATKTISVASVSLAPSLIECNNGVRTYSGSSSDPYYVNYGNNSGGNTYLWTFTNTGTGLVETDVYKSGTDQNSPYPSVQLANGNIYNVMVQFTSNGVTCSAQHTVYKQVLLTGQIASAQDTTVCYTASNIPLRGSTSAVATSTTWRTLNGSGSFSSANTLNTTYTPSTADKTAGTVFIVFDVSTSLNMNGNCGSAFASDTMALHILPSNAGTNSTTSICSGTLFQHTSSSAVSGSTFSWTSTVLSGIGSGNTANGTGNISNTLTNSSSTNDFVVRYTITPAYNGCTGVPYTVTVTVKPLPSLSITNNSSAICTGTITNIAVSSSLSNTQYSWVSSVVSGTASGASANASATTVNTITDVLSNTGTTNAVVRYTITGVTADGCINTAQTDVTVTPVPSAADAGSDQTHCNIPYINLNAQTPAVGTGTWSQVSGPGTVAFSDVNDPAATISGLTTGIYVFKWTVSNGSCTSTEDEVSVTIYAPTVAGTITGNNTVCASGNSGSISLTGNTGAILNWAMSIDNGNNWNNISNTTNTLNYNNLTTTTLYRATVQNGICNVENTNDVTITVMQAVTIAHAGNDQTLCATTSATLAANQPVSGTGTWTQIAGPTTASFANINAYNSVVNNLTTGTYTFRWTIANGVCADSYDDVSITIDAATVAGTITGNNTVCASGNSGSISLTGNTGTILNWAISIDNGNSWNNISNTTNTLNYNNLTTTTLYRASVQNGVCNIENTNNVTITVMQAVTTALAGNDQTLCATTSATLAANQPVSGTGTWTQIAGPTTASFANVNAYNSVVNNLTTGTYTFRWTIANGVCADSYDEVSIIIDAATVAGTITSNNTVCASGNSGSISLTGNTGAILNWAMSIDNGNSWNNISNNTNSLNYNNLTTTTLYRATVQNGVCTIENTNNVTITVLQLPTIAMAGSDQTLNNATTATLNGNNPVSGIGTWTQITGPTTASFADANTYNSAVNGLTTGTYTFRWTISNGVCGSSFDEMTLTIEPPTVPGTLSADATVCAVGGNGATLQLTGYTGSIIQWELSVNNGSNWSVISNTTNQHSYSNLTTTTLYRALVQNGVGLALYSNTVTITVMQAVTVAFAGNDQTLCATTNATLAANQPTSGTGTWTQIAGPTSAGFTNVNAYNTVVNNLTTGNYTFRWTISNGVCTDSYDEVSITIDAATIAGTITGNNTVCASGNSGTISLTGNTGAVLNWSISIDNGNSWNNISNTTNTLNYNNLTTTTLYRASVQNGVCNIENTNNVTITVIQTVTTALAGNDQTLCATTNATLAANQPVSGTGTWTQIAGPTTASFANINAYNSVVNNLTTGTYTFRWTIANGVCADSYDDVSITIDAATVAGTITGNNTVCASGNSGSISLTGNTGAILNWAMSIDNGNSWNNISNTTNSLNYNNLTTTTLYRASVQNGVCTIENTNNVTITVMQTVTTALAGNDQTLCATTSATLAANQPVSGTGTWTQIAGPTTASFANVNAYNSVVNNLTTGTYTFRWTIANGVCADSYDEVSIIIDAATVAGTITSNNTVCASGNSGSISLTGNTGAILNWAMSIDNGNSWNNISNNTNSLNYNNLSTTTLYRTTVQNGVCTIENTNNVTITVDAITNPGVLTGAATVCNGTNTGTMNLAGNNGSIIHWEYSVDGGNNWSIINNTANSYTFNNLSVNTLFRVLVQNGVCSNAYSNSVAIVLDPVTIPGTLIGNSTVCFGTNSGSIQVSGNNGTVQYWEYSTDGGNTWSTIAQTSTTLSYSNLTQSTIYRAIVRSGVCASATTNTITIAVTALSVGGTVTGNTTVCSGNNTGLLTLTGNTGSVLEWQSSTDGGNSWTSIANTASGFTYNNITSTTQYRAVVQNGVCSVVYSSPATITVNAVTVPGNISGGGHYCSGSNSGNITLSGNNGTIIQWEVSTNNGSTWSIIANTTGSYQYQNLTTTSQFRVLVQNGVCGAAYSNIVTIQISDVVVNTIAQSSYTVCDGQTVTINAAPATGGTGTYLYQWQHSQDGINWSDIAGANAAVYSFTPSATVSLLRRVVNSLPCSQISNIVTVTKQAAVSNNLLSANTVICFDSTTQITGTLPTGGDGVYTYIWQFSTDGGATWNNIAGANGKDLTTAALTVQTLYRRIVRTILCSGPQENISNVISIGIKYKPTAIFTVLPDTGCSPVIINFHNQSVGNNTVFLYSFGDGKDTFVNNRSTISHLYSTNSLVTLNTRLLAINECGIDTAYKTVTIKPDNIQPNLLLSDSSLCGPGTIRFTNNTKGALKYTWNFGDGTPVVSNTGNTTIEHQYTQPGTYQFTLIADNECSIKTISHTIRIHPSAVAAFVTNQPDYCVGDSVRFTNQSNHANSYRWFFGNNDSTTAASPVSVFKQAGIFQATLIAGTTYAPDNKTCLDTMSSNITVVGIRKGTMQVNSLTGNCLPHTINALSLNTPASSVVWTWGDDSSSKGETASHKYFSNGEYLVTMVAISAGGCRFIDSANIIVNGPTGSLSFSKNDVCLGQSVVFNASFSNNTSTQSDSIRWYPGDGSVITTAVIDFTYQYAKAGIYHPKAWLIKANGCMVPLTNTDSIRVDEVVSKFGLSGVFECGITTYQFVDSSRSVFGIRSWKWITNGKDSSFERTKVSRFAQKGSNTTSLMVEGNTGCKASSTANYDVLVYQYPVANISAMAEACKTDLLELKSNVNSQDSVALRLWTLGNGISAKDSIVKATFMNDGTYNIKLTVATVNNCYDSVYKQLTVHPLPKITVDQNNTVCRGDSITIRANGASRFIWKDQNENIICTDCSEIKIKPGSSMGYKVIGYNQFGCSEIKSTTVRVINPLKMIASVGDTICVGQSSNLSATGAASYQWLPNKEFNGAATSGIYVRPTETTTYKVVGKDAFNCFVDTAEIKVVVGKPTPVTLGKDTTLVSGGSYQLRLQSATNDIVKWRWSGAPGISCATCPTPVVKLSDDACISCTAINQYGCVSSDTICIKTFCPTTEVFVPNAFTPDGDGVNDKLIVQGKGIRLIKSFRIFNRWGEVVFEKVNFNPGDPAYGWDGKVRGKEASPDVYVYVCEVICEKGLPSIFKGNTAILK